MKKGKREASEESEKQSYQVHGTVTDADGRELSGEEVIVSWQRMRRRLRLGRGRTSGEGRYRIRYRLPEDALGQVLIVVEARSKRLHAPSVTAYGISVDLDFTQNDQEGGQAQWLRL